MLSRKRESSDSDDQRPKVIRQDSGQQVETEEDIKRETRHRDSVRVLQNEGTDAYQKRDFERSRDRFDRALALHETYLEAKLLSGQPAPSRMLAERDAVKCKLLKYLSRALAKLGREDESKEKLDEAVVIEQRLADYEKRKKDHKRMQVESL